jgi:cellulose synthase/poly-beta-1,6-N-acetylglucosamine synthase-like glycosyltransferase
MLFLFWSCLAVILYVYFGYPVLLASGMLGKRKSFAKLPRFPSVSVIVPARNEEQSIEVKLENLLALDYPPEKLEILVGNDASTDHTEAVVRSFVNRGVHLINSSIRLGKSAMQNALVARAHGEVLAFTDADCLLPAQALPCLLENFADPTVGLVTNCASFSNEHDTSTVRNEGLYWRYERWLRLRESDRGLLAMASGSLFAMRRFLWSDLDPHLGDDFVLPLRVAREGYRNILETRIQAVTRLTQDRPRFMLAMKMRIISKDFRGLLKYPDFLNPMRMGRIAVVLWSHKLLRWAVPYFLLALLVSNLFLVESSFYAVFLVAQLFFYACALLGFFLESKQIPFPLSVASSFCLVNFASLLGTLHCLSRRTAGQWETIR